MKRRIMDINLNYIFILMRIIEILVKIYKSELTVSLLFFSLSPRPVSSLPSLLLMLFSFLYPSHFSWLSICEMQRTERILWLISTKEATYETACFTAEHLNFSQNICGHTYSISVLGNFELTFSWYTKHGMC